MLVLDVLAEDTGSARSAMEIDRILRRDIPDMPERAHDAIAEFLDGLVNSGFIETEGSIPA
ncbi:MAG: hypothetical protein ACTHWV_05920 [Brachybacterium sp.]